MQFIGVIAHRRHLLALPLLQLHQLAFFAVVDIVVVVARYDAAAELEPTNKNTQQRLRTKSN